MADDLSEALADFRLVALRRGEYEAHEVAANRLLATIQASLSPDESAAALVELDRDLRRLIVNISCRIGQRAPALRTMRAALVAVYRQVRQHARTCGVQLEDPRSKPPLPVGTSRLGAEEDARAGASPSTAPVDGTAAAGCWQLAVHGPRHLCEWQCYYKVPSRASSDLGLVERGQGKRRCQLLRTASAPRTCRTLRRQPTTAITPLLN
eukprot:5523948-Prymnesium_polylepis.1